jgi:hypothetical protein
MQMNGVPKLFWILFAFFAYDDILPYLMAWYIYYPVIAILIFFALSLAVGIYIFFIFFILNNGYLII